MDARLIEIVVLLGLLVVSVFMLRRSLLKNLFALTIRLVEFLIASLVGVWVFQLGNRLIDNWMVSGVASVLLGLILSWRLGRYLRRQQHDRQWVARGEQWLGWPRGLQSLLTGILVLGLWLVTAIAASLIGEIAMINPAGSAWLDDPCRARASPARCRGRPDRQPRGLHRVPHRRGCAWHA